MAQNSTGRQIAAARVIIGMTQAELAAAARISVPTLKRMEASEGLAAGMANNIAAVAAALVSAGVEFIPENGGGAGVRLRKHHDDATLERKAVALDDTAASIDTDGPKSPARAMALMDKAKAKNDARTLRAKKRPKG